MGWGIKWKADGKGEWLGKCKVSGLLNGMVRGGEWWEKWVARGI